MPQLHSRIVLGPVLALGLATPAPCEVRGLESVETAKSLILRGRADEARSLLQDLAARYPTSNDVAFLLGLLAVEAREYDSAVSLFRAILVRSPDAVRVRLELGRAFFLKRD